MQTYLVKCESKNGSVICSFIDELPEGKNPLRFFTTRARILARGMHIKEMYRK